MVAKLRECPVEGLDVSVGEVTLGLADLQADGGVTAKSVHRLVGDGNDLLVVHQFEAVDEAEAFFSSAELRQGMHDAGVDGPPRIEIYEDA